MTPDSQWTRALAAAVLGLLLGAGSVPAAPSGLPDGGLMQSPLGALAAVACALMLPGLR